jgi:Fe-S-cluster containining protein
MLVDSSAHDSNRRPLPIIRLSAVSDPNAATATANVPVKVCGQALQLELTVPTEPVALQKLLPVFQGLTNAVMDVAVAGVEREGKSISCRKGCGACCRQVVPISESEARAIAELVDAMPEPRQTRVRSRFADAIVQLERAGLIAKLRNPDEAKNSRELGLSYFAVGVPCPFLEDESCSIHLDRPLACREYLVTSPAANCANPTAETVNCVPIPAHVAKAVRAADKTTSAGWLPLTLALEWTENHKADPPTRTGPEWIQDIFAKIARKPATSSN